MQKSLQKKMHANKNEKISSRRRLSYNINIAFMKWFFFLLKIIIRWKCAICKWKTKKLSRDGDPGMNEETDNIDENYSVGNTYCKIQLSILRWSKWNWII
jgi:hypothetical protein